MAIPNLRLTTAGLTPSDRRSGYPQERFSRRSGNWRSSLTSPRGTVIFEIWRTRQGHSLWRLRYGTQRGVGERRARSRHAEVCRRVDPAVVEEDGRAILSTRPGAVHHRRRGRQQRLPVAFLEGRIAEARRRNQAANPSESLPAGHEQWNKIEHCLFCHITQNWRGKPLRTWETVVELIGHTRTATGLRVVATLDERRYPIGAIVSNADMRTLALRENAFHGDWNYAVAPRES